MDKIVTHATYIAITNYELGDCPRVENAYQYYENWKAHAVGIVYAKNARELRIFSGANLNRIQYLTGGLPHEEDYHHDIPKSISIRMQKCPRNDLQEKMIQFLIGEGEYEFNKNYHQLSCNAETGEGKTYCAIVAITYMRLKTIIIVNRIHIENTWKDAIVEFTDASEKSILCLTTEIIIDILNGKINTDKYDIFIAVHRTIYNAATQVGWEGIHELFKILGIGLKIYDEAHREFANTTMIDTHTDTRKTLYLTATLKLSNPKANYIFQNLFYNIPKFDQRKLGYTDAKKHIAMIAYFYNSHPGIDAQRQCYNPRMHFFNSKAHSMYQVTEDTNFFTILDTNIVKFAIKNKFRCLILVARIKACEIIADFIKENHPEISCGIYNSSIDSVEKQRVLKEDQVIISTNSSLGESVTIKDLRFVLNCEAHRSFGDQASGRLRKLPDPNLMCYYAELVDNGFKSITSQWKSRKKHYAEIFNEIFEIKL